MAYFVEENNGVFSLQLIIFSEELADFLALLGFDAAEETEAVNDAAFMAWLVKCAAISAKYKLAWTAFLDLAPSYPTRFTETTGMPFATA